MYELTLKLKDENQAEELQNVFTRELVRVRKRLKVLEKRIDYFKKISKDDLVLRDIIEMESLIVQEQFMIILRAQIEVKIDKLPF